MVSRVRTSQVFKKLVLLISPLISFAVLLVPYSWVNQAYIVEWFGCGCPKIDELGNIVYPDFNANDFTALFWEFIAVCVTVSAMLLSRKISKDKWWIRVLYIVGMLIVSLLIAQQFTQMMMWK